MIAAHLPDRVLWALAGIAALLVVASLTTWLLARLKPDRDFTELRLRLQSWWVITAVFTAAFLLSNTAAIFLWAFVSFLALKEYLSLIPTRRADRRVLLWVYLVIPIQYWWVASGWYGMFIIFIPVYVFLFLPMRMMLAGETRGFLHAVGSLQWGVMLTVFSISHLAFLLVLPPEGNPQAGGGGLLLFLLVLTQLNDVAQYITGRLFGRRRILPMVSPNKTWEGLAGGLAACVILAWLLSPWLTPFSGWQPMAVGLLIGLVGFVGDVTVSAIKRDLGVKDAGSLLPGHGGMLDRIDSLTFTAPLFLHFTRYFHF